MATQSGSIITDEMRAAIGREGEPVTYEVDKTGCRMFARAVGYRQPIFHDEAAAKAAGYRNIVAPPHFLGTPVWHPDQKGRPGEVPLDLPLTRSLNGGTDIEYFDVVCAGDTLTAVTKLTDIQEREGRLGKMLILSTETTFRNEAGKVVAILRGTGIKY
jgi:acyl dehydratase